MTLGPSASTSASVHIYGTEVMNTSRPGLALPRPHSKMVLLPPRRTKSPLLWYHANATFDYGMGFRDLPCHAASAILPLLLTADPSACWVMFYPGRPCECVQLMQPCTLQTPRDPRLHQNGQNMLNGRRERMHTCMLERQVRNDLPPAYPHPVLMSDLTNQSTSD